MRVTTAQLGFRPTTRRWFRYSLRTLLGFVVLCTLVCSWLTNRAEQARKQVEAVRAIQLAGGFVLCDYQIDASGDLLLDPKPAGHGWLRDSLGIDCFSRAVIAYVTDRASLEQVWKLRWLEELYVGFELTNADLVHLQNLKQLKRLDLYRNRFTPQGAKKLQEALPNCQIDW